MNDMVAVHSGWYAKDYKTYVDIHDARCVFYARLYKKSTPDASNKARQLVQLMNNSGTLQMNLDDAEHDLEAMRKASKEAREAKEHARTDLSIVANERDKLWMEKERQRVTIAQLTEAVYNMSKRLGD